MTDKSPGYHLAGFQKEISGAADSSRDSFFTWFDSAKDTDASFVRGAWDFNLHIGLPLAPYIDQPENKTILDIGYGGGRMLAAAARSFASAIGVDIHEKRDLVNKELQGRGLKNVKLISTDGSSIPLQDSSVDIVYSFIVFQHVEKVDVFQAYVREAHRALKSGGLAILYFGRKARWSINRRNPLLLWADIFFENILLPDGYLEIQADVNHTNLLLTRKYVRALASSVGFRFIKYLVSFKRVPDGYGLYGGQHGILVQKS
jgi:ubiquinone/menaquinone biosynthesis C-methylase UbiE